MSVWFRIAIIINEKYGQNNFKWFPQKARPRFVPEQLQAELRTRYLP